MVYIAMVMVKCGYLTRPGKTSHGCLWFTITYQYIICKYICIHQRIRSIPQYLSMDTGYQSVWIWVWISSWVSMVLSMPLPKHSTLQCHWRTHLQGSPTAKYHPALKIAECHRTALYIVGHLRLTIGSLVSLQMVIWPLNGHPLSVRMDNSSIYTPRSASHLLVTDLTHPRRSCTYIFYL